MKKFWRSGMIDKKVVAEREREECIDKLERIILELTREEEPKYAIVHTSDNRSHKVRIGDNVILDFGSECIIAAPKERLKDNATNIYCNWLKNRKPYDSGIELDEYTLNTIRKAREFKEK